MKTKSSCSRLLRFRIPMLAVAAALLLTTLQSTSFGGGWFLPLKYPAGEYHRYWAIGLSVPTLEKNVTMRSMSDGTHIFAIQAGNGAGHIYIWDRINPDYNCPALASTDADFKKYTTMDLNNLTFLRNVYFQLHDLWGDGATPQQTALLTKLRCAYQRDGGRFF